MEDATQDFCFSTYKNILLNRVVDVIRRDWKKTEKGGRIQGRLKRGNAPKLCDGFPVTVLDHSQHPGLLIKLLLHM